MKIVRFAMQSCCGKPFVVFKTDQPITQDLLKSLVNLGFKGADHFLKAGILYVDNSDLIILSPFGSDRLQIKCKKVNCDQKIDDFEVLLQQLG